MSSGLALGIDVSFGGIISSGSASSYEPLH